MSEKYIKAADCEKYFYEHLDDVHIAGAMNAIDEMPDADVAPVRHGRWETLSDSDLSRTVMCSVCNNTFYYSKRREQLKIDMMPYCPHCGARMDEEV